MAVVCFPPLAHSEDIYKEKAGLACLVDVRALEVLRVMEDDQNGRRYLYIGYAANSGMRVGTWTELTAVGTRPFPTLYVIAPSINPSTWVRYIDFEGNGKCKDILPVGKESQG